jgi:hypothetical protein
MARGGTSWKHIRDGLESACPYLGALRFVRVSAIAARLSHFSPVSCLPERYRDRQRRPDRPLHGAPFRHCDRCDERWPHG